MHRDNVKRVSRDTCDGCGDELDTPDEIPINVNNVNVFACRDCARGRVFGDGVTVNRYPKKKRSKLASVRRISWNRCRYFCPDCPDDAGPTLTDYTNVTNNDTVECKNGHTLDATKFPV